MQTISNTTPGKPGPNTDAGKAISSLNAVKHGLFTTHDFIRLGERDEYDAFTNAFRDRLAPEGPLEELFVTEIIAANWRLRRYRLVEEDLSAKYDETDPMQDDSGDKIQRAVDRARAQAHSTIRRALTELRKLQTERHIRTELSVARNYGMAEFPKISATLARHGLRYQPDPDSFCNPDPEQASNESESASASLCLCGSGLDSAQCCESPDLQSPKIAA